MYNNKPKKKLQTQKVRNWEFITTEISKSGGFKPSEIFYCYKLSHQIKLFYFISLYSFKEEISVCLMHLSIYMMHWSKPSTNSPSASARYNQSFM